MFKRLSVPVIWKCGVLRRTLEASPDAVFHARAGWVCDCGRWTRYATESHWTVSRAFREVYFDDAQK